MNNIHKLADEIFKAPTEEELLVRRLESDEPSDYHFISGKLRTLGWRLVSSVDIGDNNQWKLLEVHRDGLELARVQNKKLITIFKNFDQIKKLLAHDGKIIWESKDFSINEGDFHMTEAAAAAG